MFKFLKRWFDDEPSLAYKTMMQLEKGEIVASEVDFDTLYKIRNFSAHYRQFPTEPSPDVFTMVVEEIAKKREAAHELKRRDIVSSMKEKGLL